MFARTILPKLTEAGIGFDIPQEVAERMGVDCQIEFYLDRDLQGITCEAVARYGDFVFQLVPTAKALRGVINPDSRSKAALIKRDTARESFAVQVVRQLFPTWSSIDVARVREEDEQTILLLLTEGVDILRSVGQVFSTAAFDGMMMPSSPTVKVGLSIDSNLVEISPIANEVPMNEVGALLNSYHRNRRYHRFRDGTFVDLKNADLHELDQIATDLDLDEQQIDSGRITIPGYQAFLLDAQVDDDGKSESFVDYVNDVKIIDRNDTKCPATSKTYCAHTKWKLPMAFHLVGQRFRWHSRRRNGFGQIRAIAVTGGSSQGERPSVDCLPGIPGIQLGRRMREVHAGSHHRSRGRHEGTTSQTHRSVAQQWKNPSESNDMQRTDVVITSYDLLRRDVDDYAACRFALMALDEAQYIKNHATKLAKAVKQITAEHRFALTGTPIENRLSELWSIFDFLMPGLLGTYTKFREKYEQPIMAPGSEHSVMADKLQALVGLFIKRRLKKDVLTDYLTSSKTCSPSNWKANSANSMRHMSNGCAPPLPKPRMPTSIPRKSAFLPNSRCYAKSAAIRDSSMRMRKTLPPNLTPFANSYPRAWTKARKCLYSRSSLHSLT